MDGCVAREAGVIEPPHFMAEGSTRWPANWALCRATPPGPVKNDTPQASMVRSLHCHTNGSPLTVSKISFRLSDVHLFSSNSELGSALVALECASQQVDTTEVATLYL